VAAALIGVPGHLGMRAQGRRCGCAAGMEAGAARCGRTAGSGKAKVMTAGPHLAARRGEKMKEAARGGWAKGGLRS
jgi:hypothetical protein